MSILKVSKLSLGVKNRKILKDISFEIPKNSITALIGPNGAGKTTTIKCITNLYPVYDGEIELNNLSNKNIDSFNKLGYVPEKENFPKEKAYTFLHSLAELSQIQKSKIDELINLYAKKFRVDHLLQKKLNVLSSGEKKKILVIQALLHDPDIIILDEPTENLDPSARNDFYQIINELVAKGKTILISTHQLDEIKNFANYVVCIHDGQVTHADHLKPETDLKSIYLNSLTRNFI